MTEIESSLEVRAEIFFCGQEQGWCGCGATRSGASGTTESLLVSKPGAFKPSPPVRVITGAGMQNQMQAQPQMRSSTKQRYRDGDVSKVEKYAPQPEKQWSI